MGTRFGFGIEESWDAVRKVLANRVSVEEECLVGVDAIRREWERQKAHLVAAIDPATGRCVMEISEQEARSWLEAAGHNASAHLRDFALRRARYRLGRIAAEVPVVSANAGFLYQEIEYAFDSATLLELADNRLHLAREMPRSGKRIPAGTKYGVYLRHILPERVPGIISPEEVDAVVDAVGYGTDALRLKSARVVVSVNPLDMLLVSEHTTGWSSCHNLGGACATGPLAFMVDDCTVVVYSYFKWGAHDELGVLLPRKVWRQMAFLDVERASAIMGREFPGENMLWATAARKAVAHVLAVCREVGAGDVRWFASMYRTGSGAVPSSGETLTDFFELSGRPVMDNRDCPWFYHDPYTSVLWLDGGVEASAPKVRPGPSNGLPCIECGKPRSDDVSGELVCAACGGWGIWCSSCGSCIARDSDDDSVYYASGEYYCRDCYDKLFVPCYRCECSVYYEDALRGADGHLYCEDCFDRYFTWCAGCGEAVWRDSAREVYGREVYGGDFCPECYSERFVECTWCDRPVRRGDVVSHDGDLYCPGCYEEHLADEEEEEEGGAASAL